MNDEWMDHYGSGFFPNTYKGQATMQRNTLNKNLQEITRLAALVGDDSIENKSAQIIKSLR